MPGKALCTHCYPQWVEECQARTRAYDLIGSERAEEIAARPEELPAPLIERGLACFFDLTLLMTFSWAILWPVIVLSDISPANMSFLTEFNGDAYLLKYFDTTFYLLIKIFICSYTIPAWIYFAAFELSPLGGTPGKLLMGLRVKASQGELTFGMCSQRLFFKLLPFLAPVILIPSFKQILQIVLPVPALYALLIAAGILVILSVLDLLLLLLTPRHSALHDLFTSSEVVSVTDVGYFRLLLCFALSAVNIGIHSALWSNPVLAQLKFFK